jgi:hypothetical protein
MKLFKQQLVEKQAEQGLFRLTRTHIQTIQANKQLAAIPLFRGV